MVGRTRGYVRVDQEGVVCCKIDQEGVLLIDEERV